MQILDKVVFSKTEPSNTNYLWIKPVSGGIALYLFDGVWKNLRLMADHGTPSPDDDTPIDVSGGGGGGQVSPNTVGSDQIVDNSVMMEDLNESVRDKIQKTYVEDDESLHMDYDIQQQNL